MNENFNIAVKELLFDEKGYSNDPADKGGETKFGISKRSYPDIDIKSLTAEKARDIYWTDFWLACRCDLLPSGVDYFVFDTAVLHGQGFAIKMVQRAVKCKVIDGAIGPNTRKQIEAWSGNTKYFLLRCATKRIAKYKRIVAYDSTQERFFEGWVARTVDNYHTTLVIFGDFEDSPMTDHKNCLNKDKVISYLDSGFSNLINGISEETK